MRKHIKNRESLELLETKKDAKARLHKYSNLKNKKNEMKLALEERDKNEFHFGFYRKYENHKNSSVSLKKLLINTEYRIRRTERELKSRGQISKNTKIVFSGKDEIKGIVENNNTNETFIKLTDYLDELKASRSEIRTKLKENKF